MRGTPKNAASKGARRAVIAGALVKQQTPAQIARSLGVSRQTVYNELANPETQALIQSWMHPHHGAIKRMIPRALSAVNKGLKPSQEMKDRLAAVKTLGTVMEWAEGARKDDSNGKPLRWQGEFVELLALYAKVTKTHE